MKKINFLKGDPSKNLLSFFIPLMLAFYCSMLFDITDSLWLGNMLGEKALAAQTVSMPLILLYNSICMGATGGVGILLAQAVGAKDSEKADRITATSFFGLLVFSLAVGVLCEICIDVILKGMHTPSGIYSMAREFLQIHILSFPFTMMYMYYDAVLRSYGNSVMQLLTIGICTIFNVIFDPVFISLMGMNGVAVTTVLSESAVMVLLIFYCRKNNIFHINLSSYDFRTHREILAKAVPSAFQQSIPAISTAFITSLIPAFGLTAVTGFGIAGRVETLLLYPPMAMNMAVTSVTGQCFGAKDSGRAKEYTKWGVITGCTVVMVLTLLVLVLSKNIASLFGAGAGTQNIVAMYFLVIAVGYVFNNITNSMLGTVNGAGKPQAGLYLMIFYYIIIRMPLAKMFSVTALGLNGIWGAVLISHIAAATASSIYCRILVNRKYTFKSAI